MQLEEGMRPVYVGITCAGWTRQARREGEQLFEAYAEATQRKLNFRNLTVAESWVRHELYVGQGRENPYELNAVLAVGVRL